MKVKNIRPPPVQNTGMLHTDGENNNYSKTKM